MESTPPDDLTQLVATWPVEQAAIGVTNSTRTLGLAGDPSWTKRVASLSKTIAAYAGLVALEEGTISLDDPAGPPGSTVRHLLSHASGLAFDEDRSMAAVGQRRIYSNVGIEYFARHLATASGMEFARYVQLAVLDPLSMTGTDPAGSPAYGYHSCVADLLAFCRELLAPSLIDPTTLARARTAQFPELRGVLPGVASFDPNPWGLGFELRSGKSPHWTGTTNSTDTFGHFGGTGTFLWVDPAIGLAAVGIASDDYGPWALDVWPPTSDALITRYR